MDNRHLEKLDNQKDINRLFRDDGTIIENAKGDVKNKVRFDDRERARIAVIDDHGNRIEIVKKKDDKLQDRKVYGKKKNQNLLQIDRRETMAIARQNQATRGNDQVKIRDLRSRVEGTRGSRQDVFSSSFNKKPSVLRQKNPSEKMERAEKSFSNRFKKTKKTLDKFALSPFKGLVAQVDGQRQSMMESSADGAVPVGAGLLSGVASAAIAVIKLTTTVVSALVSFVGFVATAVSATAAAVVTAVIVVVAAILAGVVMANPAMSMELDTISYYKYLCDSAISQKIEDDWANRYPLHSDIRYTFNGYETGVANYATAIAMARQLSDEEEIENNLVTEIITGLNEVTYDASDPVILKANIEHHEFSDEEMVALYASKDKDYIVAELEDTTAMFYEVLEGIGGNRYNLHAMSPNFIEAWVMPFIGETSILKSYGEDGEENDRHWHTLFFDLQTDIKSPSRGIIEHINETSGLMRVRYASGIMLELKGNVLIDPSFTTGTLVSSGSTLLTVSGEVSLKMTMSSDSVPQESVQDIKTGETISVPSLSIENQLASVNPILFVRYKMVKQDGQEGLRQRIVAEAMSYLGVPYQLGGASHKSIDCSGLTMVVYNKITAGTPYATRLTHGSRAQDTYAQGGAAVFDHIYVCWRRPHRSGGLSHEQRMEKMNADLALLKPGDLLFFWNEQYIGGALNNHVGIYIGKNQTTGVHEFIHATTGGSRVMIQNMMTYALWPGRARRPIWD